MSIELVLMYSLVKHLMHLFTSLWIPYQLYAVTVTRMFYGFGKQS